MGARLDAFALLALFAFLDAPDAPAPATGRYNAERYLSHLGLGEIVLESVWSFSPHAPEGEALSIREREDGR